MAALALLVLVTPSVAQAQLVPGARMPSRASVKAEFIANVLKGVDEVKAAWEKAVAEDRLEDVVGLYTSDAVLISPEGLPMKGREAIEHWWSGALAEIGTVQTHTTDVDASGQMSVLSGSYSLERSATGADAHLERGGMMTVFVQVGRRWFIRAQILGGEGAGAHLGAPDA